MGVPVETDHVQRTHPRFSAKKNSLGARCGDCVTNLLCRAERRGERRGCTVQPELLLASTRFANLEGTDSAIVFDLEYSAFRCRHNPGVEADRHTACSPISLRAAQG